MNYFDWQAFAIPRLLLRDSAIFMKAINNAAARSIDRFVVAMGAHFPFSAPDDALPTLAADASLPAYPGESAASIRARLVLRDTILDRVGTLPGIVTIAGGYYPSATRIVVINRAGYWAQLSAGSIATGQRTGFDPDSAAFGGPAPSENACDIWLAVEGHGLTFRSDLVLQSGAKVRQIGGSVGIATEEQGRVDALRVALSAHTQMQARIPLLILLDPSAGAGTQWNPATGAGLPSGQYGRATTRPNTHRYAGNLITRN